MGIPTLGETRDRGYFPGAVEVIGPAALRTVLEGFFETWEGFRVEPERIEERGEQVLVVARLYAQGRSSAASVEQQVGHVLTLRGAQIVRWASFVEASDAVRAVGLSD